MASDYIVIKNNKKNKKAHRENMVVMRVLENLIKTTPNPPPHHTHTQAKKVI